MRKQEPLVQEIVQLHSSGDYRAILLRIFEIMEGTDQDAKSTLRLLSWPSPTSPDLHLFSEFIHLNRVTHLISIGCGTGLLEWLLMKALQEGNVDVRVTGVEVDVGWWSSPYSPPTFLPLLYANRDFSMEKPFGEERDMVLFCYFNNLEIFIQYLEHFRGRYLAILGPISNTQFCAPAPLEMVENKNMPGDQWSLKKFTNFGMGDVDHLAIYERVSEIN